MNIEICPKCRLRHSAEECPPGCTALAHTGQAAPGYVSVPITATAAQGLSDAEIRRIYLRYWELDDDEFPSAFARAVLAALSSNNKG